MDCDKVLQSQCSSVDAIYPNLLMFVCNHLLETGISYVTATLAIADPEPRGNLY